MAFGWVTFVAANDAVKKSLALLNSLRSVHTSHKVVTIVGHSLSQKNLDQISHFSDHVIHLESTSGCDRWPHVVARLQCWSLPGFSRLIFLDSSAILLQNVDNLFGMLKVGETGTCGNDSIFSLEPSFAFHELISKAVKLYCQSDESEKDVRQYFVNFLEKFGNCQKLELEYNFHVGKEVGNNKSLLPAIAFIHDENIEDQQNHIVQDILRYHQELLESNNQLFDSKFKPEQKSHCLEPIAVVGASCRFPNADSLEEYWNSLINGENGIRPCPPHRWNVGCLVEDPLVEAGFLKCPVDEIDASYFGFNPMELKYTDPQQRLLLEVSHEALEDAGISPASLQGRRVGVFTATWKDDYKELMIESGFKGTEFFRTYMGNAYSASSARLSHVLGVTGPNIATESGCSASFGAIWEAANVLRAGDAEFCIASAVNLILHPFKHDDMKSVTSPNYRCKTFDSQANGFARAEGVGSLVLKRLSDAVREGDRIYGLIRGMGITQEGTSSSMGTPTVDGEAKAMQLALSAAQVDPKDIDYLEAHGTGTVVGDPIEIQAITKAYTSTQPRKQPLVIASVKTNIGHTEAAAGMASIMKTFLALKNETIPPHINVEKFNPACDFSQLPATVPQSPWPWKRNSNRKRIAGISNFGISGGDMHMIFEEPPTQNHFVTGKRNIFTFSKPPVNIVTISAKTKVALQQGLERLEAALHNNPTLSLEDVSYTLNTGRSHHKAHRVSLVVPDAASIAGAIAKKSYSESLSESTTKRRNRIVFMFPGQGTQYLGMGKELLELSPIFRHHFDICCSILELEYQLHLKTAILTGKDLDSPVMSQVAIFVVEYALVELWKSWGVLPDVVVGHSLGDYAAAVTAGMVSLDDALKLVVWRARMVSELPTGGMAVVQKPSADVGLLIDDFCCTTGLVLDVAAINSPTQTAVAGSANAIAVFIKYCSNIGVTAVLLKSSVAYHSRCLEPILAMYTALAESISYSPLKAGVVFISSMTGQSLANCGANYWPDQTINCVRFQDTAAVLLEQGDVFVDVGPHPILIPLLLSNVKSGMDRPLALPSMKKDVSAWETLTTTLSKLYACGVDVNWEGYHKYLPGEKISLPFYAFQRKKYWFNVDEGQAGNKNLYRNHSVKNEFPLIGCHLPTPLTNLIYVNYLSLKSVPYVSHHKLGAHAVFPGAGYIEMFLEMASKLNFPLIVRNVMFRAPLILTEDESMETHTIFCKDSGKAQIFCRKSKTSAWICHAQAELSPDYLPVIFDQPTAEIFTDMIPIMTSPALYAQIRTLGYNFGMQFQTVQSVSSHQRKGFLIEITVPPHSTVGGHICHPITIDAVMQGFVLTCTDDFDSLHLPSGMTHFEMVAPPNGHLKYVRITPEAIQLLDADLKVIAVMLGMETMPSTLQKIQSALSGGMSELKTTPLFEEQWIPMPTPSTILNRVSNLVNQDVVKLTPNEQGAPLEEILGLQRGIGKGILLAMAKLGVGTIPQGTEIDANFIISKFGLITASPAHKIVNRFMEILAEDNFLLKLDNGKGFKVKKSLPHENELAEEVEFIRCSSRHLTREWEYSIHYLANLIPILKGHVSALELLFPSAGSKTSAESFYVEADSAKQLNATLQATIEAVIDKSLSVWEGGKEIQILEVGAGTGSATSVILPLLEKAGISFTYTYTDISSAYFVKAENKFSRWRDSLIYKTFNVEETPESQGFPPNYYHLVVASNILHATVDLNQTMIHCRQLLKKWGLLVLAETFIPQRHYDITVGHLDGYWRFKDMELRPNHCTVSETTWHSVLNKTGFNVVTSAAVYNGGVGVICAEAVPQITMRRSENSWLIFSDGTQLANEIKDTLLFQRRRVTMVTAGSTYNKLDEYNTQIQAGYKDDVTQVFNSVPSSLEGVIYMFGTSEDLEVSDVWKCYLFLTQELAARFPRLPAPKLIVLTGGIFQLGDQSPVQPTGGTLSGLSRTFMTEFPHFTVKIIDLDPDQLVSTATADIISSQIWSPAKENSKESLFAIRGNILYVARLRQRSQTTTFPRLSLPQTPFCLQLPETKTIADLVFIPFTPPELENDQVEIQIRAIGMNFRDIFLILKAVDQKSVTVGSDVAGVVTKIGKDVSKVQIGDAVFAARNSLTPFPNVAIMRQGELLHLPEHLTFEEAVTFPVAFSSAFYGIVMLANVKRGDNVLIHTATGGVGLRAVALAFELGAKIYATAGSRRKRAYLQALGIPAEQIFSSRDTLFSEKILALGQGKPIIDIVLNSITGPGFKEASLSLCTKSAKFVELSKINIWSDAEIKAIRPDINYFQLDLSGSDHLSAIWTRILDEIKLRIGGSKTVEPLPVTLFQAEHVRDALSYLQKAKHVGKIVCSFPRVLGQIESPIFNDRSTYLIVGGLGGIGLKVAEWMVSKGAKHVVLAGRSKTDTVTQAAIQAINSGDNNASIVTERLDVSNYEDVSNLLQKLASRPNQPTVRGVMNCAGVLSDGGLLEMNETKFQNVLGCKVQGSWNLHLLTNHLPLEHFVLFSSFAGVAGTPGQSNHAAATAFQDALSAFRHNSGRPSTSINWGQWGEVGVVEGKKIRGYTPMSTSSCLASLEAVLTSHIPNAVAVEGNHSIWKSLFPWTECYFKPLFDATKTAGPAKEKTNSGTENFWREINKACSTGCSQKISSIVQLHITSVLASLLEQTPNEIEPEKELNLDSLMKIELRNSLQAMVGVGSVIPNTLSSCSTLDQMTSLIVSVIEAQIGKLTTAHGETKECFANIVKEEVSLAMTAWDNTEAFIKPKKTVSKIEIALLTGTTGNLGPYVLLQLTQRPHIKTVVCLIQAKDDSAAMERLVRHLRHLAIFSQMDMSKVTAVAGSLGQSHFGLTEGTYHALSTTVEAIFNCAAATSHVEKYQVAAENSQRQVNVIGTRDMLLFATTGQAKYVYHASSIGTIMRSTTSPEGLKVVPEGWTDDNEFDHAPNFGYIVSKFVGEKVIQGALTKFGPSFPVKVFRLPLACGHSNNGKQDVHRSNFFLKYLYYIKSGIMPRDDVPIPLLPVDHCASLSLKIFFNESAPSDVYNIVNPRVPSELELPGLAAKMLGSGHITKLVDYEEWVELIKSDKTCSLRPLLQFYTDPECYPKLKRMEMIDGWKSNKTGFYRSEKAEKYIHNFIGILEDPMVTLERDIKYAMNLAEYK